MMQDAVRAYRRRAILSLLEYDSDYRLSLDMLDLCLEQTGQNATYDQLQTEIGWLEEQGYVARSGDLDHDPRSPAGATICLQPEPAWTGGRQLVGKEAGELEPAAGRILRPDNKLRRHL